MLPELNANDALFLDFDGTLVEIAPRPGDVVVDARLRELLTALQSRLSGALAIVSGRPVADLDHHLAPLRFAAAGEHGAELRYGPDDAVVNELPLPDELRAAIQVLADNLNGTEVELKRSSVSLHYRGAPHHESAVKTGMRTIEERFAGYLLIHGKMVAELKPETVDKGLAIRDIYSQETFQGRRPVFVGDDTTDEAGFVAVNELGGVSVRVGDISHSAAEYSADNVESVLQWLGLMVTDK